jgi:hypothetical protein
METETVYKFKDLDDAAKQRAIEWYRECVHQDWEPEYGDFATIFGYLGIALGTACYTTVGGQRRYCPAINYSIGFSQSDYASFLGWWHAADMHYAELLAHAPQDETLKNIGARLMSVLLRYPLSHCEIMTCSNRVAIDRSFTGEPDADGVEDMDEQTFEMLAECMRDLASWLYSQLSEELLWQGSEENCIEGIEGNDYDFDEAGRRV